jgi:Uma2 family endonuclease
MAAIPLQREVFYPESDGKPMAETEIHAREMVYLFEGLEDHLRNVPDVYVGMDMLMYYVEGDPKESVAPDVFVTLGVPCGVRRVYKFWEEGRPPTLVVEVTSSSTRREDLAKKALYEGLGVEEYILHDPLGEYLRPALQGYRLVDGRYQPIPLAADGSLLSRVVGLRFRPEDSGLRLVDPVTGRVLPTRKEETLAREAAETAREAAEQKAAHEEAARRAAEQKAVHEEAARRAAEQKAAHEEAARRAAEEELARLRAELDRLRGQS